MKSFPTLWSATRLCACAAAGLIAAGLQAQQAQGAGGANNAAAAPATHLVDIPGVGKVDVLNGADRTDIAGTAMVTATVRAKAGDAVAAENELLRLSIAPSGSADTHIEVASRLLDLSNQMVATGSGDVTPVLIKRALKRLDQAIKDATANGDKAAVARAAAMSAFIHERYEGDPDAAAASYAVALKAAPLDQELRRTAERAERSLAAVRAHGGGKK